MTYTTKTPKLFSKFFLEENFGKIEETLSAFETAHGSTQTIDVLFVFDDGKSQRPAKKSDSTYGKVLHYNFADHAHNKYSFQRELLIRVSPV